jgi:hypothetical protein
LNLKKDDFIMILLGLIILLVAYLIFSAPSQQVLPPTPAPPAANTSSTTSNALPSQFADKLNPSGDSQVPASSQQSNSTKTSSLIGKQIFKAPPPPEKGQTSFYDEAQKAIIALEKDPKFILSANQCTQILNLIKKVEGAKEVAPKTQKVVLSSLTPEQAVALSKFKAPSQGAKTLEALVEELLATLKAKL